MMSQKHYLSYVTNAFYLSLSLRLKLLILIDLNCNLLKKPIIPKFTNTGIVVYFGFGTIHYSFYHAQAREAHGNYHLVLSNPGAQLQSLAGCGRNGDDICTFLTMFSSSTVITVLFISERCLKTFLLIVSKGMSAGRQFFLVWSCDGDAFT